MRNAAKCGALVILLFAAACSDAPLTEPDLGDDAAVDARWGRHGHPAVSVLSRNMYIGTDVDTVLWTLVNEPQNIEYVLQTVIQVFLATSIEARAGAMAEEVERWEPAVLGLQEVYYVALNIPQLGIDTTLDFQQIFEDSLAARGLDYVEAARVTDTDADLSAFGIRLVDHDVILVDPSRVALNSSDGQLFTYNLGDVGFGIEIVRGWTMIDATIAGTRMEVWNTHLESGDDPLIVGLRGLQAGELVGLASTELPVVMVGDFNDELGSPMYDVMSDIGGFADAWRQLRGWSPGFTCCHDKDLSNIVAKFDQRIDYVWARGLEQQRGRLKGFVRRTGLLPWERVDGPLYRLWASDHAGLYAQLRLPRFHGLMP